MLLKTITCLPLFFYSFLLHAQSPNKKLQKSWIKTAIENLSPEPVAPDTLYTRYSFSGGKVNISFDPGWDDGYSFNWLLEDHYLTVGYENYWLEELTDSTLVFSKANFRRFHFVSEAACSKSNRPDTTERFNEQPVYVASNYFTSRYKKEKSLSKGIHDELYKSYNVIHEHTFIAKFVVTVQGKVERVEIVKGISTGFDNDVIKQIKKTSGDWYPAKMRDAPVNCEMTFQIKYLDSMAPNLGVLHDTRIQL